MRRVALATFAAGVVAFGLFVAVPFGTKKRNFPASITSPPPLFAQSTDTIPAGAMVCMRNIAADAHSEVARIKVGTFGRVGTPLALTVNGPGYAARATAKGGYPDNHVLAFRVRPPAHDMLVTVCVRNEGSEKIGLYAADDRARSRVAVTVGGRAVRPTPTFGFWESRRRTIAARLPVIAERIAAFRGPLGHTWIVWLVLCAAVVALPVGIGLAIWRAWSRETSS